MKKLAIFLITLTLFCKPVQAMEPAVQFINTLTDKIITNVLTSQDSEEQKINYFRQEFTSALDLKSIGQFVLGRYWKMTDTAQRDAFLDAFMEFTTLTWADRFHMYNGQKIIFTGTRNAEGKQLYVDSKIMNNGTPVEVIWRVRQKGDTFKIIDIIVEGVSMAMSYRNEYTAFLQKNGGDVSKLTAELKTKAKNFQLTGGTDKTAAKAQ